jgi:hypothetical protein
MQLSNKNKPRIAAALCMMTANLLASTGAIAQDNRDTPPLANTPEITNVFDEPADDLGTTSVDSAVLYYKENGGRVTAIEPMISIMHTAKNGNVLSAKLTYDSLSGASPNGATPWSAAQTFVVPIEEADGATGASGTVVLNPLTGKYERRYTIAPNTLPTDDAFRDRRAAFDLGFSTAIGENTKLNVGANGSKEKDFLSVAGRIGVSHDLNNKATTLSLGVNFEHDKIDPFHHIPTGLKPMSGVAPALKSDSRNVLSVVAGVTQILKPNWLVQLNYSFGSGKGYQTDPYRFVSVLNPATGAPLQYLYEARPDFRTRHSVYAATKIAFGSFVTDLSARYYHDSWGIDSITLEGSEHIPIGRKFYVEPSVRYYKQSKADFFTYFLPSGSALPSYASADSRLDSFSALSFGGTAGFQLTPKIELYVNGEMYNASKSGSFGTLPSDLATQQLFGGADSVSGLVGLKFKF